MQKPEGITQLLVDWSGGDGKALDQLMPLVYGELRRQAANYLRRERIGHTLQPTALVNEAYLKLVDQKNAPLAKPRAILWCCRPTDAAHSGGSRARPSGGEAWRL